MELFGDDRTLTGNGVPNHGVAGGQFATQVREQKPEIDVPVVPRFAMRTPSVTI